MASQSRRNSKGYSGAGSDNGRKSSKEATPEMTMNSTISAPKYGTVVPERVFVGGISANMTETELTDFFSKYGKVTDTKIIVDRAGVSKGYGFITFETADEAQKLLNDADNIMLRERKLNIAPAVKKQSFNQRLDVSNGTASMVGAPLFGGLPPFTFHNGVTYFCHHPNGPALSAPQPTAPQPPPPQTGPPPTQTAHIDPNLYSGYSGIQTPTPQYHQVVYNPIYYQTPQYQYPITCEAVEGSMSDNGTMQGVAGGSTAVAPVIMTPNGYYIQEIPYPEYTYSNPYIYQAAPEAQPQQAHHTVMQYTPTPTQTAPPPRQVYDAPVMVPEVFPHPQNIYPRPPSGANPFNHYSTNHLNNSTGNFMRKFRKPFNPNNVKGRGSGRGGGSVSSYSSGGGNGGNGLDTPPSTPRSGQPSPDHHHSQTVSSSQDHLVNSMKTLKAS